MATILKTGLKGNKHEWFDTFSNWAALFIKGLVSCIIVHKHNIQIGPPLQTPEQTSLPLTVVAKYTHQAPQLPAAICILVAAIRFAMVIGVYVVTPSGGS